MYISFIADYDIEFENIEVAQKTKNKIYVAVKGNLGMITKTDVASKKANTNLCSPFILV